MPYQLAKEYEVVVGIPQADAYRQLRVDAGMSPKSAEAAAIGLPNSLFSVMIHHQGRMVGMGRVVGDGGLFFEVVDIAVEPEHQGRGLGKAIMTSLMEYLDATKLPGAFVSLMADGDAKHLYAKFGFDPVTPLSIGMALPVK